MIIFLSFLLDRPNLKPLITFSDPKNHRFDWTLSCLLTLKYCRIENYIQFDEFLSTKRISVKK